MMSLQSFVFKENESLTRALYQSMPYAQFINLKVGVDEQECSVFKLPFEQKNVGNTIIASIHGGLIGGLVETATVLTYQQYFPEASLPKVVDLNLDYLRAGKLIDMYASCSLVKEGKRIVNYSTQIWQSERNMPIVVARVCLQV